MGLYLNGKKVKLNINSASYYLNIYSTAVILNGIKLLTSDNSILKDLNGLYITAKESE